tara:strand:- start:988 stop:1761 length:774 start_codon:yes stop_codon:yes gene_type:complete
MTSTIDDVEDYWDKQPCNSLHSKKEIGTKDYFEEVESRRYKVEPHIKNFVSFEKWNNKHVLEIGCGIGTEAINFAKFGAHYTGTDLSEESIKIAKMRFKVYNKKAKLFHGNSEELSNFLPIKKYDLIYSFGVIHHSPYPKKIISEIKKYMHADTILQIMVYAKNSWKNFMIEVGLDQPEAQYGCPIANTYSKEEVIDLLQGLKVLSIDQKHIFPYKINDYKQGKYNKEPWFESMPPEMFDVLQKKLGWHLLIKAKLQ